MTELSVIKARRRGTTPPPEILDVADPAEESAEQPGAMAHATAQDLMNAIRDEVTDPLVLRFAEQLIAFFERQPGDSWQSRWEAGIESHSGTGVAWLQPVLGVRQIPTARAHKYHQALRWLISIDAIRPSYRWMNDRRLQFWPDVARHRDPAHWNLFETHLSALGLAPLSVDATKVTAGHLAAHTGKPVHLLTADDVMGMANAYTMKHRGTIGHRRLTVLWRVLRELGWLQHDSVTLPSRHRRQAPRTCEQLVDRYDIADPQRTVLVHYLRARKASLDYTSLEGLSQMLCGLFWADVVEHCGPLPDFALSREQGEAWKARIHTTSTGEKRRGYRSVMLTVRSFYTDIAMWAQQDSYWASWVAPTFIYAEDTAGEKKDRRRTIAKMHQRIRQTAPLLPQVVRASEEQLVLTRGELAAAKAVGDGGSVQIDGIAWAVAQASQVGHVWVRHEDEQRDLTNREDSAFWTWAAIEILQHTGIRIEELLELTHLSLVPHKLRGTGEVIPLLHIAPSKTDEERLLVVGPELAHVLAEVVSAVRNKDGHVPLVQRWDPYEKTFSEPLPFLFQGRRKGGTANGVISSGTIRALIQKCVTAAGIKIEGKPLRLTPHDFRRIFATDALAAGMPPHIIKELLGHKSIVTTEGYAAVYPQHVISGHRGFINRRRTLRPSEEYRRPSPEEWEAFDAHFVKRRLELGTCGRAYGSDCRHEHACIRCELLRPDPAERPRLLRIVENLKERIAEANDNGWLGEVEGLETSLAAARVKLADMERIERRQTSGFAELPMPTVRVRPR